MKTRLAFAAVMMVLSSRALAADDWLPVTTSTTGSVWKVRFSDILNTTNQSPHVWIHVDASKDATVQYREQKQFAWIDCAYETVKTVSFVTYRADGTVIDSSSTPYAAAKPIVPDTVMSAVKEAVCPSEGKLEALSTAK